MISVIGKLEIPALAAKMLGDLRVMFCFQSVGRLLLTQRESKLRLISVSIEGWCCKCRYKSPRAEVLIWQVYS
ncbi:hypothetical protein MKW98_008202 [Papaver atlanticum]|uniref:Uncharacterized protein n=1 Tax=Papaver atlanticum TaxID=357466 RepID=A0AAD4X4Q6_9MAGN|nr:hypothetical protein MKW98_008202 [Papaver atlanticum]